MITKNYSWKHSLIVRSCLTFCQKQEIGYEGSPCVQKNPTIIIINDYWLL